MPFDGDTYVRERDAPRMMSQLERVKSVLSDGKPHRLDEIMDRCGTTSAGVTARIRDLRTPKFGLHRIQSWADKDCPGLWWYLLEV